MVFKHRGIYLNKLTLTGIFVSVIISTYYFYDYLIQTSYSVLPQEFDKLFNLSTFKYSLLGSMFFYGYTIFQIPAGYLIDKKGIRKVIISFCGLCVLGMLLFSIANSYWMLMIGRFLIGAGSAAAFLCATVGFSRWLPHKNFSVAMGLLQLLASIGSICGQAGISYFINAFGWRSVFWGMTILGGILTFTYFLTITTAGTSLNTQKKLKKPTLKQVLKTKQLYWIAALGFISWSSVTTMANIFLVRYLYYNNQWSTNKASSSLIVFWLAIGFVAPWLGKLSNLLKSRKKVLYIGFILQIICTSYIALVPNYSEIILSMIFIFLGASAAIQVYIFLLVKENISSFLFGSASGLVNMCVVAGGGLLSPIIGWVISILHQQHHMHYSESYKISFYIFPILAFIGLIISFFFIRETYVKR